MSGMGFNHHGASGSEGCGGITSSGGVGKREVGGAEDHYGPDGGIHFPYIRAGRNTLRQSRIDPGFQPDALFAGIGIAGELKAGAAPFIF